MSCKYVDSCPPPVHYVNVVITMPPLCSPSLKGVSRRWLDSVSRKFGNVYPANTWKVYLAILKGICLANTWTTYLANLGKLYQHVQWRPGLQSAHRPDMNVTGMVTAPLSSTSPAASGTLRNVTGMTSQASKSWEYILQTLGKYILQIFGRQVLQILGLYILQNLGKCSCKYLKATFCKYLNRLCKRGYLQSRGHDACLAARCFDDSQAHDSTRRLITQSWRSRSSSSSRPRARRVPHRSVCILQLWNLYLAILGKYICQVIGNYILHGEYLLVISLLHGNISWTTPDVHRRGLV